jgi:hypothetical protein
MEGERRLVAQFCVSTDVVRVPRVRFAWLQFRQVCLVRCAWSGMPHVAGLVEPLPVWSEPVRQG